jgi:hypothetical protein
MFEVDYRNDKDYGGGVVEFPKLATDVCRNLSEVFIYISLMPKGVEHFFREE